MKIGCYARARASPAAEIEVIIIKIVLVPVIEKKGFCENKCGDISTIGGVQIFPNPFSYN